MATARQERWVMVRLLRETRERIKEWVSMQDTNFVRGTGKPLRGQEDGVVSVDAAIAELLRRDQAHRERARKAAKSRKAKARHLDDSVSGWSPNTESCLV
jgi:hypothetical protein